MKVIYAGACWLPDRGLRAKRLADVRARSGGYALFDSEADRYEERHDTGARLDLSHEWRGVLRRPLPRPRRVRPRPAMRRRAEGAGAADEVGAEAAGLITRFLR